MASTHARALPRPHLSARTVDLLVGLAALLVIAGMTLLTPAFTDYEVEIEPTLTALMRGDLAAVGRSIPIYGASLLLEAPASAVGWMLGGDVGMYRATAVPGALAILTLGVIGAGWVRAAGGARRDQLAALLLVVAAPTLAQAWSTGHHEEVLVAALAIGGILVIERSGDRRGRLLLGAFLLGLAVAGKLWPLALVPVALACTRTWRQAFTVAAVSGVTTAALVVPNMLAHLSFFKLNVTSAGGNGIFTPGNVWWFLGSRNPDWIDPRLGTRMLHAEGTAFREAPSWLTTVDHPLILGVAVGLSAAWWWRARRAPADRPAVDRTASLLLLVASVVWWRALLDGWFQPYYLTTALAALALADARRGRMPVAAAIAWSAMWIFNGQGSLTVNWSPDLISAVTLAWAVPVGVWSTVRALRSAG